MRQVFAGLYDCDELDDLLLWPGESAVNVQDIVKDCVLFLGTKEKGHFRPKATAFHVRYDEDGLGFIYLITAEHNITGFREKNWDLWNRANLKDGKVLETKMSLENWWFHPDSGKAPTDVAVCPVVFHPDEKYRTIPLNGKEGIAGTADVLAKNYIGLGDEIVITGLFRSHHGRQQNIPIIRIGTIATMKEEPVYTKYCGYTDAYLIEARSISGLSGSPVFVNVPPFHITNDGAIEATRGSRLYFLGLMHGHFDVQNLNEDMVADSDDDASKGINTGIGVVIPVEKIIETLEGDEMSEQRKQAVKYHREKRGATPDFAVDEGASPTNNNNPAHKEDFTALLTEAARKQPQGD